MTKLLRDKMMGRKGNTDLDLRTVIPWGEFCKSHCNVVEFEQINKMHLEATNFLNFYNCCDEIIETFVGIMRPGIVGVFLIELKPRLLGVDEWVWVIVGDLPPAYITTEESPDPFSALDGYIGAMEEWVEAAKQGRSVEHLVPVNVPATPENANLLEARLNFLDTDVLSLR